MRKRSTSRWKRLAPAGWLPPLGIIFFSPRRWRARFLEELRRLSRSHEEKTISEFRDSRSTRGWGLNDLARPFLHPPPLPRAPPSSRPGSVLFAFSCKPQLNITHAVAKDALPMCVVTGQHMVKEDWCLCPRSRMPALMSHYESYLQHEQVGAYVALAREYQYTPRTDH